MRPAVLLIIAIFVAVPALLMLFSQGRTLASRVFWTAVIFIAPFLVILVVQLVPALNGQSLTAPSAWRAVGVLLMTASFILPWCLFAILRRS